MPYDFKHVEPRAIQAIAAGVAGLFESTLAYMKPQNQIIDTLIQDGNLQGADIDVYRSHVLPTVIEATSRHLERIQGLVHEMLIGRGSPFQISSGDFWDNPPTPTIPDTSTPNGAQILTVTPGLRGQGYLYWREAIIDAAIREIDNTWYIHANDLMNDAANTVLNGAEFLNDLTGHHADDFLNSARREINRMSQAVHDTGWRVIMEGAANPESWTFPLVSQIWNLDLLISGINHILDHAQFRLGNLDKQVQMGFDAIQAAYMPAWPSLGKGGATTSYNTGITPWGGVPGGGDPGGGGTGGGSGGGSGDGGGGSGGGSGDGGGSGGGSGDGGFGGGTGGGSGAGGFPPPVLSTTWGDTLPDQFPMPQNMEDVARELIRRQGGSHHLLLITHFGPTDQNNWLVTIPDRGNSNYTQDPGDPGGYTDNFGSAAHSAEPATPLTPGSAQMAQSATPLTSNDSTAGAGASQDATVDGYLNNSQAITTELGGRLSPYGQFVAQAAQQYCTSQPPDPTGASSLTAQNQSAMSADQLGGPLGTILRGRNALGGLPGGGAQAVKLTTPPTSPQNPALLWLAGHGLGGLVAQNLAALKPFPGDNPSLSPAHVVKGVIAFGAPIVGQYIANVAYSFFKMPGDRLGDVPVDTVGVRDARLNDVHQLSNPFVSPPWQSSNPQQPNYVKDPNDPQLIHNSYADSDALAKTPLPFDILGKMGKWGPTYVVVIPQATTASSPIATGPGVSAASAGA